MILITGASGFIGKALCAELHQNTINFCTYSRAYNTNLFIGHSLESIIHLAGRAHVLNDEANDPLAAFRVANCDYALQVAKQAVAAGVKRFVYVSSIGVNGAESFDSPYTENGMLKPHTPYAQSKYEAEVELTQFALHTGLEFVIIRPPLVYGGGAPGNFGTLLKWSAKALPLPLGAIYNSRSLLYVKNLVNFLSLCAYHPKAANQTFLLSDGEDVSTTRLLQTLAKAQGVPSRLLPVPASWLGTTMRFLGKGDMAQRLLGNLQIDSSKARELLGWTPPFTFEQGIQESVKA